MLYLGELLQYFSGEQAGRQQTTMNKKNDQTNLTSLITQATTMNLNEQTMKEIVQA